MTGPLGALMHGIRDSFGLEITRSEVKAQVDAKNGRSKRVERSYSVGEK